MKNNDLFLDNYLNKITEDFKGFAERSSKAVSKEWYTDPAPRIKEFADKLEMKFGNKYIKILSGGSAHSFIVNTDKASDCNYVQLLYKLKRIKYFFRRGICTSNFY